MMTAMVMDQVKVEAFVERMLTILNDGALVLMTSIGHRTGLFDTMATLPAATSTGISQAAGLNERYVREWLAAMVTGGIVDYDPAARTYCLPPEHAAWLTRAASPNNLAVTAQLLPVLAAAEDGIVAAFHGGGGLPYAAYGRFHDVMAEDSGQTVVAALIDGILPLVPGLTDALDRGIDVLDLGCGQGRALILMAQTFPNSRFTGYDTAADAIAVATDAAEDQGLPNLRFSTQDAAKLDESAAYDLICTFDAIHDQAQPARVLCNIARALRLEGTYLMQDIRASSVLQHNLDHPAAPLLYTVSTMHCTSVSLGAGGDGLGTMWGQEQALALLAEAGFARVEVKQLPHDIFNDYYICTRR
jgi:SAM-dependent methyltransferase